MLSFTLSGKKSYPLASSPAYAATLQAGTAAQPLTPTITNLQRTSATAVKVTFTADQDYSNYALRYRDQGGNWQVINLGHHNRSRSIVVVITLSHKSHHHLDFEVCGVHGKHFEP